MQRAVNFTALLLYIFLPIAMGILQIFAYGISIVNMAMVLVSISLYIFTYLDINDEVQKAHSHEMNLLREEQNSMKQLFAQTTDAFIKASNVSECTAAYARNERQQGNR